MGYKISSLECKRDEQDEELRPTEQRIYGHNLSNETRMTRKANREGKARRAYTLAQNMVSGGKAPSPRNAKKEEI